jgi:hypothetical protein
MRFVSGNKHFLNAVGGSPSIRADPAKQDIAMAGSSAQLAVGDRDARTSGSEPGSAWARPDDEEVFIQDQSGSTLGERKRQDGIMVIEADPGFRELL